MLNVPGLTVETQRIWTLDDYVQWLYEKLINEKEIVLIGHSNGGRLAIAYAAKYPDKLNKLILIDSAGIYHNELPIRLKRLIFKLVAKTGTRITASEYLRKLLYKVTGESDYKNASPLMRKTMINLISKDLTMLLSEIKVPTTIIWGRLDKITPLSDALIMNKKIKNSKLYIIEEAKHSPYFTHPEELGKKILDQF